MQWRFRKAAASAGDAPGGEAPVPLPTPETQKSPGLGALLARLDPDVRYDFLDLGRAVGSNVEYLAGCAGRFQVADVVGTLREEPLARTLSEEGPARVFPAAFSDLSPCDVVLAWDTFNYLDPQELQVFAALLQPLCRPGAALLAFLSTGPEIPADPPLHRIVGRDRLSRVVGSREVCSGPVHRPIELEQAFAEFSLERAFQLRRGAREFLLIRRDRR